MRRFVTYIYEYERGIRGRNVGFVRTDLREDGCRMELQIRGFDRFNGKCPVYLTVNDPQPLAIPAAELLLSQGMGSCRIFCAGNRIGKSNASIRQTQTLNVDCGNRQLVGILCSCTPEPEFFNGNFAVFDDAPRNSQEASASRAEAESRAIAPQQKSASASSSEADAGAGSSRQKSAASSASASVQKTASTLESTVSATAPPRESESTISSTAPPTESESATAPLAESQSSPVLNSASVPDSMSAQHSAPPVVSYKKIEITDIRRLPKSNWNLCSNRFLIHGFFNYRYLILKTVEQDNETKQYLGVPGIYEQPERMMALLFGFPEFETAEKQTVPPSKNLTGIFGYWMCPLT